MVSLSVMDTASTASLPYGVTPDLQWKTHMIHCGELTLGVKERCCLVDEAGTKRTFRQWRALWEHTPQARFVMWEQNNVFSELQKLLSSQLSGFIVSKWWGDEWAAQRGEKVRKTVLYQVLFFVSACAFFNIFSHRMFTSLANTGLCFYAPCMICS